jgi:hypothetical protein
MKPDEVHRPRECGDSIGQTQLEVPASSLGLFHHDWMVGRLAAQEPARDQLWDAPGSNGVVIGCHGHSFRGLSQAPAMRALYPRVPDPTVSAGTLSTPRSRSAQQDVQNMSNLAHRYPLVTEFCWSTPRCTPQQRLPADVVGTHSDGEKSARHDSGVMQSHTRSPNGRY